MGQISLKRMMLGIALFGASFAFALHEIQAFAAEGHLRSALGRAVFAVIAETCFLGASAAVLLRNWSLFLAPLLTWIGLLLFGLLLNIGLMIRESLLGQ